MQETYITIDKKEFYTKEEAERHEKELFARGIRAFKVCVYEEDEGLKFLGYLLVNAAKGYYKKFALWWAYEQYGNRFGPPDPDKPFSSKDLIEKWSVTPVGLDEVTPQRVIGLYGDQSLKEFLGIKE